MVKPFQPFLIGLMLLTLAGCSLPIGAGVGLGRRPIPDYIAQITFTDNERANLITLFPGATNPLRDKIIALHADYVGMLAERRAECSEAIDVNGRQLATLNGFSHAEVVSALHAMLRAHGWPESDPIVSGLNARAFTTD